MLRITGVVMFAVLMLPLASAQAATVSLVGDVETVSGVDDPTGLPIGDDVTMELTLGGEPDALIVPGSQTGGSLTLSWGPNVYTSQLLSLFPVSSVSGAASFAWWLWSPGDSGADLSLTIVSPTQLVTFGQLTSWMSANPATVGYIMDFPGEGPKIEGVFRPSSASEVPLPAAAWLFLSGVAGLIGLTRTRRHRRS